MSNDVIGATEDFGTRLSGRASRGAVATLVAQWTRFVIQLGSTAALARILSPADYGLVAMVVAFTGLGERFKDLGLSAATIQKSHLTHRQVTNLFWINTAVGAGLTVVTLVGAPVLAAFYGRPALVPVTAGLSATFLFGGLAVQHHALLVRGMRYHRLAVIEVAAMIVAVVVALTAGLLGAGYWALVLLQVVQAAVRCAGSWLSSQWRPGLPTRHSDSRGLLVFGGHLSFFNVINYAGQNVDNIVIGRFLGAGPLGLYSKAYQLLLLPINQLNAPIANVAIRTLSYLRDAPDRYRAYYLQAIGTIAYVAMPAVALIAVLSAEAVRIVLGDQWVGASALFRVLAIGSLALVIGNTTGWLYISSGRADRMARWAMMSRPFMIIAFLIGVQWDALGVAAAYAVAGYALLVPGFVNALRDTPVNLTDVVRVTWRPFLISVMVGLGSWVLHGQLPEGGPVKTVVLVTGGGVLLFAGLLVVWRRAGREFCERAVLLWRSLRGSRGASLRERAHSDAT